ncbi:MAG: FeoB small GTPase domain-containing protein, partial [Thermodesulfobacteriota bacterium]|nr:FeoB small GTPase domain-containing protein [Thermodesulfobacteriota bacterium]
MKPEMTVALAGQPNSGKSTIFNMLTGARQFVANYPGVTVEKKTGRFKIDRTKVELVDLPGTYSLTSYSLEERVARDYIIGEKPDMIVNIVDASNLKRQLYFTLQLLEMEIPMVISLNMMDVASSSGMEIDTREMEIALGAKIVPTVGKKGRGKKALRHAIANRTNHCSVHINYGTMEPMLCDIVTRLKKYAGIEWPCSLRWLSVKLMEGDAGA